MKKLTAILLFATGTLLFVSSSAQQAEIDSLENLLKKAPLETTRVNILNQLCLLYGSKEPEKAIQYGNQALDLAKQLVFKPGIAASLNHIGKVYHSQSNYNQAINYFMQSLTEFKNLGNEKSFAACLMNIGVAYEKQGKYGIALDHHLQSLKIREKLKDKSGIAGSLNNIGIIYFYQGNYEKTIEFFMQSLKIREGLEDKYGIATSLNNIGIIYRHQSKYEEATSYFLQSLKIKEELEDKLGIAQSLNNFGNVYFAQGSYVKAADYYKQSLKMYEELGDKQGIALSLINLGAISIEQENYEKAIEFSKKSLIIAKEIGSKNDMKETYLNLAQAYAKQNRFKGAYEFQQYYSDIKDSIYSEQSAKQIAEMQTKYETEKKVKEIELLKKENEIKDLAVSKQKLLRNSFIAGLALALALVSLLYNRYRIKQKANALLEEQNQFISQQNEEINVQKEQLEDSNQKLEKRNKQITDSINYASRIQQSILPSDEFISKLLPDSFILFKPRDIVSGDFYWFNKKNDKILLAAVDCTGHGVPGAFMSMIGNTLLNEIINEKEVTKPADILEQLNSGIKKALHQNDLTAGMQGQETTSNDGMDLSLISIDPEKRSLTFAGAKRPLYVASNGTLNEIKGNVIGIGGSRKKTIKKFTQHEYSVKKSDTIYLFSDGYSDQFGGPDNTKFMTERFKRLLLDIHDLPMDKQQQKLENTIEEWKGESRQIDDILVIGVRI